MARRQTAKTALTEESSTAEAAMETVSLPPTGKSNFGEADSQMGTTSKNSKEDKHGSHKESETVAVVGRTSEQKMSSIGDVEKKQGPAPFPTKNSCCVEALGEGGNVWICV